MSREDPRPTLPDSLADPQVSLVGEVNQEMARSLTDQLNPLDTDKQSITMALTTAGGDAELVRRMVLDIDEARERLKPKRLVFLGKSVVYSAGVTLMAAFPREDRLLTSDTMLLIHCRQLNKTVELSGPIRSSLPELRSLCHQVETGIALEEANFERLIAGSRVTMGELLEKALYNWYVSADEALELGLVDRLVAPGEAAHAAITHAHRR